MKQTAARTIAELCRKLGEKILGEIVPLLRSAASSPNPATREGVCLVLTEIMYAISIRLLVPQLNLVAQAQYYRLAAGRPRGRNRRDRPYLFGRHVARRSGSSRKGVRCFAGASWRSSNRPDYPNTTRGPSRFDRYIWHGSASP